HLPLHSFPTRRSSDLVRERLQSPPCFALNVRVTIRFARLRSLQLKQRRLEFFTRGGGRMSDGSSAGSERLSRRAFLQMQLRGEQDRKSTRLNSSHVAI